MFEILVFLFEHYLSNSANFNMDNEALIIELEKMGFDRFEINQALQWLDGLIEFQKSVAGNTALTSYALRHYLPAEAERLGIEGRGLLLYLEQIGILDPITREIVIDRIMALHPKEVTLGRIKWIVLIVLFKQPDKQSALTLMQDIVLADAFDVLH